MEQINSHVENLSGKVIVLGVSGSIAAYKSADLTSELRKAGADVFVAMTESATALYHPFDSGNSFEKPSSRFLVGGGAGLATRSYRVGGSGRFIFGCTCNRKSNR